MDSNQGVDEVQAASSRASHSRRETLNFPKVNSRNLHTESRQKLMKKLSINPSEAESEKLVPDQINCNALGSANSITIQTPQKKKKPKTISEMNFRQIKVPELKKDSSLADTEIASSSRKDLNSG